MRCTRVVQRGMAFGLAMLAGALSTLARAQPAADLTGVYAVKGGELAVFQAESDSLVYYSGSFPQGSRMGTCECLLAIQKKKSPTEWTLQGGETSKPWTLRVDAKKLTLQGNQPGCCGAQWPGASFPLGSAKPPRSCKVKASRAWFYAPDEKHTQRKVFVVAGDSVEAYVPDTAPNLVLARFKNAKKTTAGLLKHEEIDCQPQASTAPRPPATATVDVTPLAGKWIGVEREGQGYVIREHCEDHPPRFTLKPEGTLEMDAGQELQRLKVATVTPGDAGAYTLELIHGNGSKETVEWSVVDAKLGIVRLKGANAFQVGPLFVRDDKKDGIPMDHKGCDESEEE